MDEKRKLNKKDKFLLTNFTEKLKQLIEKAGDKSSVLVSKLKRTLASIPSKLLLTKKEMDLLELSPKEEQDLTKKLNCAVSSIKQNKTFDIDLLQRDEKETKQQKKNKYNSTYYNNLDKINTTLPKKGEIIVISQKDLRVIDNQFLTKTAGCNIYVDVDYGENANEVYSDILKMMQIQKRFQKSSTLFEKEREILFCEYGKDSSFNISPVPHYSAESVLRANLKLDDWANNINTAKINGEGLSPLERYMCAYNIVTNFASYKLDESSPYYKSRAVTSVLNEKISNGEICCVGYAKLLVALCKRVGINCIEASDFAKSESEAMFSTQFFKLSNHATVRVSINDPKYAINGLYHADPCFDSLRQDKNKSGTMVYALNNIEDVFSADFELGGRKYAQQEDVLYNNPNVLSIILKDITNNNYFGDKTHLFENMMLEATVNQILQDDEHFEFYKNAGFCLDKQQLNDKAENLKTLGYNFELNEPDKVSKGLEISLLGLIEVTKLKLSNAENELDKESMRKKYEEIYSSFDAYSEKIGYSKDDKKKYGKIQDVIFDKITKNWDYAYIEAHLDEIKATIKDTSKLKQIYHEEAMKILERATIVENLRKGVKGSKSPIALCRTAFIEGNIAMSLGSEQGKQHIVENLVDTRQSNLEFVFFTDVMKQYLENIHNIPNNKKISQFAFPEQKFNEWMNKLKENQIMDFSKSLTTFIKDEMGKGDNKVCLKMDILNTFGKNRFSYIDVKIDNDNTSWVVESMDEYKNEIEEICDFAISKINSHTV